MSSQPPPPFGQQPPGPGGFGGPPPPGSHPPYGEPQPPGYGAPPPPQGGFGGPGFGGPPGFDGGFQPPPPSGGGNTGVIVAIIAAIVVIAGGVGAFLLLSNDDEPEVVVSDPPTSEADDPTEPPEPPDAPTPPASPTGVPTPPPPPPAAPTPPPPPETPLEDSGDPMDIGEIVQGEITEAQPTVDFSFTGTSGSAVEITMVALAESLDPVLRLYGPDGALIEENDDFDIEQSRNARVTAILPAEGQYRIEAASFAGSTGPFEISLTFPSVLTDSDVLSDAVPEISYEYEGVPGTTIRVDMVATDDTTDPFLRLIAPDGTEVASDDDGGEGFNARLEYVIDQPGTYTVVAGAFGTNYGPYDITLTEFQ